MNLTDKNSESSYICWTSSDLFAGSNVEMIYGCNGDTFPSELEISKETRAASFLQARLLFLLPRHCQVAWWWRLDAVAADMIRWCWFPNVCPEWPSEVPGGRSQTSCGDSRTHKQPPCCWFQFAAFRTSALCERFVLWFKRCLFGFFFMLSGLGQWFLMLLFITLSLCHVAACWQHHWSSPLCSSLLASSLSSAWHCLPHATLPPQLQRSPSWGSQAKAWQDHWHTMPVRVMLRWDPLRLGNALGFFPTLVFCCTELGITTESSYHPRAFLTDSNHCLL